MIGHGGLGQIMGKEGIARVRPALSPLAPLRQCCGRSQDEQNRRRYESKIMADRLTGYRILILETREEAQFSRLLAEQGADVMQCPMFTI
jgi:hypothetical protein